MNYTNLIIYKHYSDNSYYIRVQNLIYNRLYKMTFNVPHYTNKRSMYGYFTKISVVNIYYICTELFSSMDIHNNVWYKYLTCKIFCKMEGKVLYVTNNTTQV